MVPVNKLRLRNSANNINLTAHRAIIFVWKVTRLLTNCAEKCWENI